MARTETGVAVIAPQTRAATGVDAYEQHFADPTAGIEMASLAKALGLASTELEQTEAQRKIAATKKQAELDAEYSAQLDHHAQNFISDHTNGLVDSTQVGKALPGASPIVVGKVTGLIGQNWGNTYARGKFDEFLAGGDANRLDTAKQRTFFDGLLADVAKQTQGNPFYGQGALSATKSLINEFESNLQRETATYHQKIQEDDFTSNVTAALQGQPVSPYLAAAAGSASLPHELASATTPLGVAQAYLGASEGNTQHTETLSAFIKQSAGVNINPQQTAWCAAFVNAVLGAGGDSGTNGALNARSFLNWGTKVDAPQKGDVVVLQRNGSTWQGHVGFYMGTNADGSVRILGGNQGDAVSESNYPAADVLGYRRGKEGMAGSAQSAPPGSPLAFGTGGIDPATSPVALLEMIGGVESRGNYNAYSGKADNTAIQFTGMSINDVTRWQRQAIASGETLSSAVGKYAIIRSTLLQSVKQMGLTGEEMFTPQMQDSIAMHLLKGRGYEKFVAGELTASQFQDNLAKEWASLPNSAGQGHYAGQRAKVGSEDLRVAMSTQGPVPNPVAGVDLAAMGTTSINPIRSREIIVTTAIQLATAQRDTAILDRIPANMLAVPEIGAKVEAARRAITSLSFDDWNHQRTVEAYEKTQAREQGEVAILKTLSETGRIDPAEYMNDPDLYAFAKSVQADEWLRPEISTSNRMALGQQLLGYGTTGVPQDLRGDNDFERMRTLVMSTPGLTASDRQAMLGEIPVYLEGVNLLNAPETSSHYTNYVGNGLNSYMMSIAGTVNKLNDNNTLGQVRQAFDQTLQGLVEESIADGLGVPRGAAKRAMLKEASDAAMQLLTQLKEDVMGPATTPPTSKPPVPTTSTPDLLPEQIEALKAKVANNTATDEELLQFYLLP